MFITDIEIKLEQIWTEAEIVLIFNFPFNIPYSCIKGEGVGLFQHKIGSA